MKRVTNKFVSGVLIATLMMANSVPIAVLADELGEESTVESTTQLENPEETFESTLSIESSEETEGESAETAESTETSETLEIIETDESSIEDETTETESSYEATEESIAEVETTEINKISTFAKSVDTPMYATVVKSVTIYDATLNGTKGSTKELISYTYKISDKKEHTDGTIYYSLTSKDNKEIGYVSGEAIKLSTKEAGVYQEYGKQVTIKNKNFNFWNNFDWEVKTTTTNHYGKVYVARGYYGHVNGSHYLSLYDNKGEWQGYINEEATQLATNQVGFYQNYGKHVTIKSTNFNFWNDFNWEPKGTTASHYGKVYVARGYYDHYNGSRYLSLYDNKGNWQGYINEEATRLADNQIGVYQNYGKHVTIKSKNDKLWNNFDWEVKATTASKYGKVYVARGYYDHYNGSRYLSLYDNKGNWQGYINEEATRLADNQIGVYQNYGKHVTIKSKNDKLWNNFDWEVKATTASKYGKVYVARGYYDHYNGSRYLSLYDNKGNWQGYINEAATQLANNQVGLNQSYGKYVVISASDYKIWQNFEWKKKDTSAKHLNKTYLAKGYYDHYNGSRYLSIYDDQGKWLGYINEQATKLDTTLISLESNERYYVTITNKNFDILLNLNGVKKNHTKNYYMNDVRVAEHHVNSKNVRYLSIYSSSNEWIGYVDDRATNINAIKLADSNTDKQKNVHVFVMGHGNRDPGAGTAALNERDFTRNELLPYLKKYAAKLKNSSIEFYDTTANMYNDTQNGHGARSISNNVLSVTEIHLDASVAAAISVGEMKTQPLPCLRFEIACSLWLYLY